VAIGLLACLVSCKNKEERKENVYAKNGISFTIPDSWKVTSDDVAPGKGVVVNCERQGPDESGLVSIAVVDSSHDIQNLLISTTLENKVAFGNMGGTFEATKPVEGKFNGYESISGTYKAVVQDVPHTGMVTAFRGCDRCVLVVTQEADEDHEKNKTGIEQIRSSLKCTDH
jgi:hypothetical protein